MLLLKFFEMDGFEERIFLRQTIDSFFYTEERTAVEESFPSRIWYRLMSLHQEPMRAFMIWRDTILVTSSEPLIIRDREKAISSREGRLRTTEEWCENISAARYLRRRDLVVGMSSVSRTRRELARSILVILSKKRSRSSRASLISFRFPLPNLRSI